MKHNAAFMSNPKYIAYPQVADTVYVKESSPKDYPRRDTFRQAAIDAADVWHNEGRHYVVYVLEGETVRRVTLPYDERRQYD